MIIRKYKSVTLLYKSDCDYDCIKYNERFLIDSREYKDLQVTRAEEGGTNDKSKKHFIKIGLEDIEEKELYCKAVEL